MPPLSQKDSNASMDTTTRTPGNKKRPHSSLQQGTVEEYMALTPANRPPPTTDKERYQRMLHDDDGLRDEARTFVKEHWWESLVASSKYKKFAGLLFEQHMFSEDGQLDFEYPAFSRIVSSLV